MSRTVAEAIGTIRYHLRDRGNVPPAFTTPEYQLELNSQMRYVAGKLLLGDELVTGIVTTVGGTPNYALPGAQQYADMYEFRSQTFGLIVPIVSLYEFEWWRQGSTTTQVSQGLPYIATIRENAAQLLEVLFWPTPGNALVYDGYRSLIPASFYTAGGFAMAADQNATTIPFDDQAFEALCWFTAAALFKRMPTDDRQKAQLADTTADDWPAMGGALIRASRMRRIRTMGRPMHRIQARRW